MHSFAPFQFQASSWKNLILKVCRGAYPPLPSHLPYELHYLLKQMFKTNPKDRPSVHTILTSHRASRLLRAHLSSQVTLPPSPRPPSSPPRTLRSAAPLWSSFLLGDSQSSCRTWNHFTAAHPSQRHALTTRCRNEHLNSYTTSPAVESQHGIWPLTSLCWFRWPLGSCYAFDLPRCSWPFYRRPSWSNKAGVRASGIEGRGWRWPVVWQRRVW